MKCLEELEQKILSIIESNKTAKMRVAALEKENSELIEKNRQLEAALVNEANTVNALTQDKVQIKTTIEELLISIDALEQSMIEKS